MSLTLNIYHTVFTWSAAGGAPFRQCTVPVQHSTRGNNPRDHSSIQPAGNTRFPDPGNAWRKWGDGATYPSSPEKAELLGFGELLENEVQLQPQRLLQLLRHDSLHRIPGSDTSRQEQQAKCRGRRSAKTASLSQQHPSPGKLEHTWAKPFFGLKTGLWGIASPRCPRLTDMGPKAVRGIKILDGVGPMYAIVYPDRVRKRVQGAGLAATVATPQSELRLAAPSAEAEAGAGLETAGELVSPR